MSGFLWVGDVAVLYAGVSSQSESTSWKFAEHPTLEQLPALQFIAPEGGTMRLRVRAHHMLMSPKAVVDALKERGNLGEVFAVQDGPTGAMLGWVVLTNLDEDKLMVIEGVVLISDITITLRVARPPAGVASEEPAAVNVSPQYEHEPEVIDLDREPSEVSTEEITRA
jgi:phage protein U